MSLWSLPPLADALRAAIAADRPDRTAESTPAETDAPDARRLREAAGAFEALFVQLLVREMRQAQLERGLFGDGPEGRVYEGLFEQHLAERLAEDSPFGIADALLRQWSGDHEAAAWALAEARRTRAARLYETLEGLPAAAGGAQVSGPQADEPLERKHSGGAETASTPPGHGEHDHADRPD